MSFIFNWQKFIFQSDQIPLARKTLEKAISVNKAPDTENRYLAKLNYIKHVESIDALIK